MKKTAIIAVIAFLVMTGFGRSEETGEESGSDDVKSVVAGGNEFAFEMYRKLAGENDGNLFFSPVSIRTAFAMTYTGARGQTEEQMARVLHFALEQEKLHLAFKQVMDSLNSPREVTIRKRSGGRLITEKKPAYQLSVANALWGQQGYKWKDKFLELTRVNYGAGLHQVDFTGQTEAARETINEWTAKKTKDKIKDLVPKGALNSSTRMVLTNAVYFKSQWSKKFKKIATEEGKFYLPDGKSVETPLMFQKDRFLYMETDDFQALVMPYQVRDLSMIVLLPRKVDGLDTLQKKLSAGNLDKWIYSMDHQRVEVTFPKFKFTSRFSLAEKLAAMGMSDAFSAGKADFFGMTEAEKLFISAVIHKAFVAVNEEGTEAAAATAVLMTCAGSPSSSKPVIFKADHPFLFFIRHNKTGSILFAGHVVNPKEGQQ